MAPDTGVQRSNGKGDSSLVLRGERTIGNDRSLSPPRVGSIKLPSTHCNTGGEEGQGTPPIPVGTSCRVKSEQTTFAWEESSTCSRSPTRRLLPKTTGA